MAKGNTLQTMLDRAKAGGETPATTTPPVAPAQALTPVKGSAGRAARGPS